MQAFDLDQLRTLLAVVEAGSVTAGARRVFLSQSSASEQLRKLEERAGLALLARSRSGATATPAGERLLDYARRLLALSDEAWRDLHQVPLHGELRLAITDYFRPAELASLLARLASRYPAVRLRVDVARSSEVEARHGRGQCDLAVSMQLPGKTGRGAVRSTPAGDLLRTEPLRWMAAPQVRPRRDQPLPLLALSEDCALHQFTVGLLTRRGVRFHIVHIASGVAGLQSALAAGLGIACLNDAGTGPGFGALPVPTGLPGLPRAAFRLLPARPEAPALVKRMRELLIEQLATP